MADELKFKLWDWNPITCRLEVVGEVKLIEIIDCKKMELVEE